MLVYSYDKDTLLYRWTDKAFINPVKTEQEGREVYFLPSEATFTAPVFQEGFIPKYNKENDDWDLLLDNRGKWSVNSDMIPIIVDYVGDLHNGYVLITEEQRDIILEHPNYYIIQNNTLIKNPNYEQEEAEKEAQRIAMLSMTKYDFYKHVCKPNGIEYAALMQLINSNDEVAAAWNFCERVYRGDQILVASIRQYLPSMTDEALTAIFEEYGG